MERHQSPGHECPECHGTGVVFVFPHREGAVPLRESFGKEGFRALATPYTERCGMCGGDGWVDRRDELTGHGPLSVDWLIEEKRNLARQLDDGQKR